MQTVGCLCVALFIFAVSGSPTYQWDEGKAAGAMMMAEGIERMKDGVAMKEKYGKKFDVFGVPVGGEIGYKVGAGDSINRDKRQAEDGTVESDVEEEFDIEMEIPEGALNPNGTDGEGTDPKNKKWHRKVVEACLKFIRRVGEYFSR
uniref:Secreted protein n=1 Tax=Lutzomyia longipalpis TaxID=7200 RepID=A0A1B0CNQ6_LUTLO